MYGLDLYLPSRCWFGFTWVYTALLKDVAMSDFIHAAALLCPRGNVLYSQQCLWLLPSLHSLFSNTSLSLWRRVLVNIRHLRLNILRVSRSTPFDKLC